MLRTLWAEADTNADSKLDLNEIKKLLVKLNIQVKKQYLKPMFAIFDKDKNGYIDFEEFENIMDELRKRSELKELFNKYKNPITGLLTAEEVKQFLENEQGEKDITIEDCRGIINWLV